MPEGPEVRLIGQELNTILEGSVLLGWWLRPAKGITEEPEIGWLANPVPVNRVYTRGKQIIFDFGEFSLNSWLSMAGKWQLTPGPKNQTKALMVVGVGDGTAGEDRLRLRTVYYNDWRFGKLTWLRSIDVPHYLATKVGRDLLDDPPTEAEWIVAYRGYPQQKQICQALMDQNLAGGVGNYGKAEILYRAGVIPSKILAEFSDTELVALRTETLAVLNESLEAGGTTIESYLRPLSEQGTYQDVLKVYGRSVCPLNHPISKTKFKDGRNTHWCQICQM